MSKTSIMIFIDKHKNWIETKMVNQKKSLIKIEKLNEYKQQARDYIPNRVKEIANKYGYKCNNIKITSAKTRWWSCTSQKNLNFSFRLILTPLEIIDYVICHELAHLKQMNHSGHFWKEVSIMDENYRKHDKRLKEHGDLFTY